jgi:hypothetical protein
MCLCAAVATVTNSDSHEWLRVFEALDCNMKIEYS